MVNRDSLNVDGVEMQFDYVINEKFSLYAQATYMDLELEGSDTPVRQRPEWRGSLAMRWNPSEKWLINASWLRVGETFDSSIPTGDMFLDSYDRVDVTATFRPTSHLDVIFSVDNLLNEDYFEAIGFPSPDTRARLGIRYRY
jgi:outer membrane receptor protein involved in Fe transport